MNQFTKIFSLQVHHNYFENGAFYPIQFSWSVESKGFVDKFGIRLLRVKNGVEVFYDRNRPIVEYLEFIESTAGYSTISVLLSSNDQNFGLYSDFDLDFLGRYHYSSSDRQKAHDDHYTLLHEQKQPGEFTEFAEVEISFKDILEFAHPPNYVINLEARKTRWNYFIINQSQIDLQDPKVTGKEEIEFEGPSKVNLPNGNKALLFSSGSTLLKLSESPEYEFSLVNYQNGKSKLNSSRTLRKNVFKALPNPDPGRIEIYKEDGANVVASPMYVYV